MISSKIRKCQKTAKNGQQNLSGTHFVRRRGIKKIFSRCLHSENSRYRKDMRPSFRKIDFQS